jgi:protein SCO1/2
LLSISFDPEWDTPARLALYARQYSPDPAHWQFVTSDFWNLDGLTEQLGLQFWKASGSISHNLRTAVFDTRGRLQTNIIGNEWKVEDFVAEMKKAAQVK